MPLNKEARTFCILTSCERTDGLKVSHTAWFTHTFVRLSQFSRRWYLFIFSERFPSGSRSFINVGWRLPVLSPLSDQFPPFANHVAAKHFAFTEIIERIGRVKQLSNRRGQIYSDYTLLAFAISLFPLLLRGGLPSYWGYLPLELTRSALTDLKASEMSLAIFPNTVANPSCMAAKDIFLLNFRHRKSLPLEFPRHRISLGRP